MIYTPQWILVFKVLLLHVHHGNNVCTQQTQKKGAMNSCTHTSSLTTKCLSAPSDQLLAPRHPLNTAAVRGCKWGEGRCGFISEDSLSFWCALATRQRGFMTLEMLLSVGVWRWLKSGSSDAAQSVTFPVTTLLSNLVQYQKCILSRIFLFF